MGAWAPTIKLGDPFKLMHTATPWTHVPDLLRRRHQGMHAHNRAHADSIVSHRLYCKLETLKNHWKYIENQRKHRAGQCIYSFILLWAEVLQTLKYACRCSLPCKNLRGVCGLCLSICQGKFLTWSTEHMSAPMDYPLCFLSQYGHHWPNVVMGS